MKTAIVIFLSIVFIGLSRELAAELPFWRWVGSGLAYGISMEIGGRLIELFRKRLRKYRLRAPWERVS